VKSSEKFKIGFGAMVICALFAIIVLWVCPNCSKPFPIHLLAMYALLMVQGGMGNGLLQFGHTHVLYRSIFQ